MDRVRRGRGRLSGVGCGKRMLPALPCAAAKEAASFSSAIPAPAGFGRRRGKSIMRLRVHVLGPHDGQVGQGLAARQVAALGLLREGAQAPLAKTFVQVQHGRLAKLAARKRRAVATSPQPLPSMLAAQALPEAGIGGKKLPQFRHLRHAGFGLPVMMRAARYKKAVLQEISG